MARHGDQLPLAATRDALGIARATLHAERLKRQPSAIAVDALTSAIEGFELALELAARPPGTLGHRAAWSHAEEAVRKLCEAVSVIDPMQPIMQAAIARVTGRRDAG